MTITINIAKDFSRYPAGRFRTDGPYTGTHFREDILLPNIKNAVESGGEVEIVFDGTLGYGSSFLEEAFGGLVRERGYDTNTLRKVLVLKSENESIPYTVWRYIKDARPLSGAGN